MNVLLLTTEYPPVIGGIGTFSINLAGGLQSIGCRVRVVTTVPPNPGSPADPYEVIRIRSVLNRKVLKILPLSRAVMASCRRDRPDFLIAMTWTHEGLAAWRVSRALGIPFAIVAHGGELLRHDKLPGSGKVMRRTLAAADQVIANSSYTRSLLAGLGIAPHRVEVLHPPVPDPSETGASDIMSRHKLSEKRVILTASRLVRRKGHAQVIKVMASLKARFPGLVYVMTGEGRYRQELEALTDREGIRDSICMTGFLPDADLKCLYRHAEIYVSPSEEDDHNVEGFGIALAEAALAGLPVIAGRTGGVPDVVKDGETGFLIDPQDLAAIAARLAQLLEDSHMRQRLGQRGRELALITLDPRRQAKHLCQILLEAMTTRARARNGLS